VSAGTAETMDATDLERLQAEVDGLGDADLQRLLSAAVRTYSNRSLERREGALDPFAPESALTPTEVIVAAGQMLRAAEISSFELATIFNF
jgi:phage portal protein BeeE